jgi:hypothetical protein
MNTAGVIPPDVQKAVVEFTKRYEKIRQSLMDELDSHHHPSNIYHYTNDVGLKGILETGQLWLTDIFDLNDPSELKHGFSTMLDILLKKAVGSPEHTKFAQGLAAFYQRRGIQESGNHFVCSFSAHGNDLCQWRAYSDNGRGYALGFDRIELGTAFTKPGDPWYAHVSQIVYDDNQLAKLHEQLVDTLFTLISLPCSTAVLAEWYTWLTLFALNSGLFFKHEAYENEQEYRFFEAHPRELPVPSLKRRPRRSTLIKYREFEWRRLAPGVLKEIIVGPAADAKELQFAKDCLRLYHSGNVKLTSSGIPYRAV